MEEILNRLAKWRNERGLDKIEFDAEKQASFIFEEIGVEYLRAKNEHEKVDALCDTFVFSVNGLALIKGGISALTKRHTIVEFNSFSAYTILIDANELLDDTITPRDATYILSSIASISASMIDSMGYDFEKCMEETLKEIESRTGAFNETTGKWEKFKTEEAKAKWYKADYSWCKNE